MNLEDFEKIFSETDSIGNEMYSLIEELYPICRSITGNGVRKTLEIISKQIPLEIHEVPTGTNVFDWKIPKEWNIVDAYVANSEGKKIIDFKKSNLHVVNYSIPINTKMTLNKLSKKIHTLPEQPNFIPYLTSYYHEDWGFCMAHNEFLKLENDDYTVVIESSLKTGSLTYGEFLIKGKKEDEILISCYICHPSLCNDNLSGTVLTTFLAKYLKDIQLEYSIRFLFLPETIGSITWLCLNEKNLNKIKHGLVATCVGDSGASTYKKSRIGDAEIDKIVQNVLKFSGDEYSILDFEPTGSDERQYCSPGFNLPVGVLMKTMHSQFPEYHTSADNLDFIKTEALTDSFEKYLSIIFTLENNFFYLNTNPKCEPQLSKRGIYSKIGSKPNCSEKELALLWVLNMSDGKNSLLDISTKSGIDFITIKQSANVLFEQGLLELKH